MTLWESVNGNGWKRLIGQPYVSKQCSPAEACELTWTDNDTENAPTSLFTTRTIEIMSDSDEGNEAGVPSWQLNAKVDPAERDDESPTEEPSRATVIEQAKKFLEEDEVRNSTTDKKIAFLESKGLRSDEIQDLLGISRDLEASSPAVEVGFRPTLLVELS